MYEVKIDKFEGPFDVLLTLIDKSDLDITEVSLSKVAEQFLEYTESISDDKPEKQADFLVIASRLLWIKSKTLLPDLKSEEDDVGEDLEEQLKMYKKFYEASKKIEEILSKKNILFAREKIAVDLDVVFNPPKRTDRNGLREIFEDVLKQIEPIVKIPKKTLERVVSIREKIDSIKNKIRAGIKMKFSELVSNGGGKTEQIVTFLGILELVKQRDLTVNQDDKFGEINIEALKK
jgi:segregation and condensation protein A